jgi:arylsulfatase A-like enzyme
MKRMKFLTLPLIAAMLASPLLAADLPNTLTENEKADVWHMLFNGKDLTGWRAFQTPEGPGRIGDGWKVEDGVLKKLAGVKGGDIITEKQFNNYELSWEWRIAPDGNNGVKYLVTEARPGAPGHEYQMLDDTSAKWSKLPAKDKTAAFYEVLPPVDDKGYKPAGEWNESRILVKGNHVEHWLNGRKALQYELGSDAVKAAVAASKFKKYPDFGQKIKGHIMLTDHGDEAWFRNIKIRELSASARKPNILVILADDLGYGDVGVHGCKDIPTPNIDAFARSGIRFSSGYVSAPLCGPTRAALMTGRYQSRFGHEFNPPAITEPNPGKLGLDLRETTFAQRMKSAGYVTGALGKWHLGEGVEYHPLSRGFDEFFGFTGGAHSYFKANDKRYGPIVRGREPVELKGYLTDILAEEANDFMERHHEEPFFLYLAFNAVHTPMEAPDDALAKFASISDPGRRVYAALTWQMDQAVGRVMKQLRDLGLAENTLVFFLSDNGGPLVRGAAKNGSQNAPLRGGKTQLLEGGIRVPFMVSWPGVLPAGQVDDRPVIQLDIVTTGLAAAGVKIDPSWKLDGVDLLPYLTNRSAGLPHEALFWRHGGQWAVRKGPWKLVRWLDRRDNDADSRMMEPQLFNVVEDIGEQRNLIATQPEKASALQAAYDDWNKDNIAPAREKISPGVAPPKKKERK